MCQNWRYFHLAVTHSETEIFGTWEAWISGDPQIFGVLRPNLLPVQARRRCSHGFDMTSWPSNSDRFRANLKSMWANRFVSPSNRFKKRRSFTWFASFDIQYSCGMIKITEAKMQPFWFETHRLCLFFGRLQTMPSLKLTVRKASRLDREMTLRAKSLKPDSRS